MLTNTTHTVNIFITKKYIVQHLQNLTEEWFETTDYSKKENFIRIYNRDDYLFVDEINTDHTLATVQGDSLYFIQDFNPDNYSIGVYEFVNNKN